MPDPDAARGAWDSSAPPPRSPGVSFAKGAVAQGSGQQEGAASARYGEFEFGLLGKRRNIFAAWIGLPIITFGIYTVVWVYKTNKEMAQYDQRIKVSPTLSVLAFVPGFLLIIPPFVAAWRLGVRVQQAQRAAGVRDCSPAMAFVLWILVFRTGVLYLQYEINKIWDRYPGAAEGQPVPLFG